VWRVIWFAILKLLFLIETLSKKVEIANQDIKPEWPDWANFSLLGDYLLCAVFFKLHNYTPLAIFINIKSYVKIHKIWAGQHFGRSFHKLIWSSCSLLTSGFINSSPGGRSSPSFFVGRCVLRLGDGIANEYSFKNCEFQNVFVVSEQEPILRSWATRHRSVSLFYFQKLLHLVEISSSLLQHWRCNCKFRSRRIGSRKTDWKMHLTAGK
jgi:hypothetical protein